MKKLITFTKYFIIILIVFQSNCIAQSQINSINGWRDKSGDLPNDKSSTTTTLLVIGGIAVVSGLIYYIVASSSDSDTSAVETKSTSVNDMDLLNGIFSSSTQNINQWDLFISNENNYLNSNSTNFSVGVKYSF